MLSNNKPIQPGNAICEWLRTSCDEGSRGEGDPQSNLSWQNTQGEHGYQASSSNTWKPLPVTQRGPSTNKKEYIPYMSVLTHFQEQCFICTCMTKMVFAAGIYWYMCGCYFTTYMRLIWEKRSESEFKSFGMWQKIKPQWMWFWSSSVEKSHPALDCYLIFL